MRHTLVKFSQLALLTLVGFGLPAAPSFAAEYWLCAQSVDKMMPDSTMVPMWGFAMDDNDDLSDGCPANSATVPGPKLTADANLTIHLRNDLTGPGVEPVSIVIPGQAIPDVGAEPVFVGNRVRSFVQEAATGGGSQTYTWNSMQPGTYLYESGTHPQVQVQMGLYGALTKDSAANTAYTGVPYTQERDLFYSEVDPALHAAVSTGNYGSPPWTSTLNYVPKYFLLHGDYDSVNHTWEDVSIDTGSIPPTCIDSGIGQGDRLLLRLYNSGLRELAPMLLGAHFDLVAEGGKPYPFARTQYQTLLMPGSTKDAVFTPEYEDDFKLIERRLNLTDAAATGGGMQTCIMVAGVANNAPTVSITAPADGSSSNSGDPVNFAGTAADTEDGDLSASLNWTSSIDGTIGSGTSSFSTSALSVGVHTITASVTDGGGLSGSDLITVTVNPPGNDPAVTVTAPTDGSVYTEGDSISFTGTANDTEDGDISGSMNWNSSIDGDFGTGASVMTSSLSVGSHTITASVTDSDGRSDSDSITVTVNAAANTAPVVTITNPLTGATFTDLASIPFTGTAIDAEDGDITGSLSWTSDVDGNIGSGGSFSTTLSLGPHTITASATDDGDPAPALMGSDSIMVNIIPATTDTLFCNRARYQRGPDRMTIEVESSDNTGALTMTAVMDVNGDGFGGGDDVALNALPFTAQTLTVYRQVTNDFSVEYGATPTSTSQIRVTSSLGGQCTSYVQAR